MASPLPALTAEQRHAFAARLDRANQALAEGRAAEALPLLVACCRIDPGNLFARQNLRAARRACPPPWNPLASLRLWALRRRLRAALAAASWRDALDHAEELLAQAQADAEAHRALASAFEALGLTDQAVWALELARLHGVAVADDLARLYRARGNLALARELTVPPPDLSPAQQADEARLQECLRADPGQPGPRLELAALYQATDRFLAARRTLEEGLGQGRGDFELGLALAELDLATLRRDLALLAEEPGQDALRQRLQHELGSRELSLCQQRAARYPAELRHQLELGTRLLRLGLFEEALAALERARGDTALAGKAWYLIGFCHLNRRKLALARAAFEQALTHLSDEEPAQRREAESQLARLPPAEPRS